MGNDDRLGRIEKKIDSIQTAQNTLRVDFAKHQALEENHQGAMEKFWTQNWPKVLEKIDKNAASIAKLEVQVAELRTKMMLWGSILTVGVPILATILQIYIAQAGK